MHFNYKHVFGQNKLFFWILTYISSSTVLYIHNKKKMDSYNL